VINFSFFYNFSLPKQDEVKSKEHNIDAGFDIRLSAHFAKNFYQPQ